jgi:hypothetical protein
MLIVALATGSLPPRDGGGLMCDFSNRGVHFLLRRVGFRCDRDDHRRAGPGERWNRLSPNSSLRTTCSGGSVMAGPRSKGEIIYPDGCRVLVNPGSVVAVAPVSPCSRGLAPTNDTSTSGWRA